MDDISICGVAVGCGAGEGVGIEVGVGPIGAVVDVGAGIEVGVGPIGAVVTVDAGANPLSSCISVAVGPGVAVVCGGGPHEESKTTASEHIKPNLANREHTFVCRLTTET